MAVRAIQCATDNAAPYMDIDLIKSEADIRMPARFANNIAKLPDLVRRRLPTSGA